MPTCRATRSTGRPDELALGARPPALASKGAGARRRGSFEVRQELLEARVVAQDVVVGIVLDPIALAPAACEHALETRQRRFLLAGLGMQTGGLDQGAHVVGIELERSARPFSRALVLTIVEERPGA